MPLKRLSSCSRTNYKRGMNKATKSTKGTKEIHLLCPLCFLWPISSSASRRSRRSTRIRHEHPDHPILPGREEQLSVGGTADVQIRAREARAHRLVNELP